MRRDEHGKRSSVSKEAHLVDHGDDSVHDFALEYQYSMSCYKQYLEGFPHDGSIGDFELGAALSRQYFAGRYPEFIIVENTDNISVLPITSSLNIADQFLSQKLTDIGTEVTRM
jgi:hypothetical protein